MSKFNKFGDLVDRVVIAVFVGGGLYGFFGPNRQMGCAGVIGVGRWSGLRVGRSQHPGDGGPDVEVQRLEQQVDSHSCVADDRGTTVGHLMVLDPRVQRLGHGAQCDEVIEGAGVIFED